MGKPVSQSLPRIVPAAVQSSSLLVGDVAKLVGLSTERVKQLDAELRPERTPSGGRIYARTVVEAFAAERERKRAAKPPGKGRA